MDPTATDRDEFIKSLSKKELRRVLNRLFEWQFDPLGMDAPIRFQPAEDDCEADLYCTLSGESYLEKSA